MKENAFGNELPIPEYVSLNEKLKCESCSNTDCSYCGKSFNTCDPVLDSIYSCDRIMGIISMAQGSLESICFAALSVFFFLNFVGFWPTMLKLVLTFIGLSIFDICFEFLIKFILNKSEQIRKNKFHTKVKQIEEENKAIRKANLGITEEADAFFNNSIILYNELNSIFDNISSKLDLESKIEKRVIEKFKEVLNELKTLNSKLSMDNIENSYITTLYEVHLPKLLEYSKRFLEHFNSTILTSHEISEFSNLLEVFRVKIANHAEYLKNKVEDDFLIKMKALNEDVIPDFDGSEANNNG